MPRPAFPRAFSLLDESVGVLGKEDFENPYLNLTEMSDVYGSDVLDGLINKGLVKANPKRGSSTDKKEAFQDFLNRGVNVAQAPRGIVPNSTITNTESPGAPSQMPMDMGGGIQQMPYRYGEQGQEGIQQMPYRGGGIPGTAIGNMGGMATDLQKGIEALKEAKEKGGLMNEETRRMMEMLQGY